MLRIIPLFLLLLVSQLAFSSDRLLGYYKNSSSSKAACDAAMHSDERCPNGSDSACAASGGSGDIGGRHAYHILGGYCHSGFSNGYWGGRSFWYVSGTCEDGTLEGPDGLCVLECPEGYEQVGGVCEPIGPDACENAQFEGSVETLFGCQCPPGTYYKTVYDGSGGATQTCAESQQCNTQHPGYQGTLNGEPICDPASQCPPGYQGGMATSNGITQLVCTPEIPDNDPTTSDGDLDGDGISDDEDPDIDGDGIDNEEDDTPTGEEAEQQEEPGTGVATDCTRPPTSTGDPQLAAIHLQMWKNHCENEMPNATDAKNDIQSDIDAAGQDAVDDMNTAFGAGISDLEGLDLGGSESTGWLDIFPDISCTSFSLNWNDISLAVTCQDTKLLRDLLGFALAVFAIFSIFETFTRSRQVS